MTRFRREGAAAVPVAFGSHRKPEAILLPYAVYERYEALERQRARLDHALSAAQSVQVELPGPFSPEHRRIRGRGDQRRRALPPDRRPLPAAVSARRPLLRPGDGPPTDVHRQLSSIRMG